MNNIITSLPIMLYIFKILTENEKKITNNLSNPCKYLRIFNPVELVMTFILMHIGGYRCVYDYGRSYQNIVHTTLSVFPIFGESKVREVLQRVSNSMISWKLLLLQRQIVEKSCPELLRNKKEIKLKNMDKNASTLDIDGISFVSFSKKREGSQLGYHKRYKGKHTLQGSASFIGNIFIDFKLFPGDTNVCTFFKKAIKRAISLGYHFTTVRVDTIYGKVDNLLFMEKLYLSYAMGIRNSLLAVKKGKLLFQKLAREGSSKILHITKGSAILDLGLINIATDGAAPIYRRVILCRRIHRKRKKGKWQIKTYFYAIVTNLDDSPRKVFAFYHQRQNIENSFKELQYHYSFAKLCSHTSLKANEFWMITKLFALACAKIFAFHILPKRFKSMYLRSIIRILFANSISHIHNKKVQVISKAKYLWYLKRVFAKIYVNTLSSKTFILAI